MYKETTNFENYYIFSALVIHHCIISFLLGVELSEGKSPKVLKYLYSFGFAISISVGIAVGIGVHTTPIELYIFIVKGSFFKNNFSKI